MFCDIECQHPYTESIYQEEGGLAYFLDTELTLPISFLIGKPQATKRDVVAVKVMKVPAPQVNAVAAVDKTVEKCM